MLSKKLGRAHITTERLTRLLCTHLCLARDLQNDLKDLTTYGYCLKDDTKTGNGDETLPYGVQMVRGSVKTLTRAPVPAPPGRCCVHWMVSMSAWAVGGHTCTAMLSELD